MKFLIIAQELVGRKSTEDIAEKNRSFPIQSFLCFILCIGVYVSTKDIHWILLGGCFLDGIFGLTGSLFAVECVEQDCCNCALLYTICNGVASVLSRRTMPVETIMWRMGPKVA
jgi:hypothetical protein